MNSSAKQIYTSIFTLQSKTLCFANTKAGMLNSFAISLTSLVSPKASGSPLKLFFCSIVNNFDSIKPQNKHTNTQILQQNGFLVSLEPLLLPCPECRNTSWLFYSLN